MSNAFRTLILPASVTPLAQAVAASFGSGAVNMWTTPLSPTGAEPATHYVSTGLIPEEFAYLMPTQEWAQDEHGAWTKVADIPGNPAAVYANASANGVACTLADIQAIFATSDVTPQEPFVAMGRLGLKIINPPE